MELEYAEEGKLPLQPEDRSLLYHAKTAYLITKSDVKTTILPATTFALTALFSGALSRGAAPVGLPGALLGLLRSVAWTWMNLWVFNLSNQRLPSSVVEDAVNKPWRAIPAGRLTCEEARQLLLLSIPAVALASAALGGSRESLLLMVLTWVYNDLGAAEGHFALRHASNALGFTTFGAGAAAVACGPLDATAYRWLAVVAAAIAGTIQLQDMEDQEGDRARARRTLPLVHGDAPTRRVTAAAVVAFSLATPAFWQLSLAGYLPPAALGAWIAARTLTRRDLAADKKTFRLWCLWLMLLYVLPFGTKLELAWGRTPLWW
ncbi:ubiA prenyltransferase [Diplocarpon mali]|nr:ubiA prenyltransferase [Diplocarpon mali]